MDQAVEFGGEQAQPAGIAPMRARHFRGQRVKIADRHWVRGDKFATAFLNALSVVFPRGETFMIEALLPWRDRAEGRLAEDIATFIEQEAAHSREHVGLNKAIIDAGYDIEPLDSAIKQFVAFFDDSSELTKLGATMCIEHLTAIVAAEILSRREHLEGTDLELRKLWLWHAVEEVEHKAVAFDAWMFATRDWGRARRWLVRSGLMVAVSASFFVNRTRGQVELLRQDGLHWTHALPLALRHGFAKGSIGRNVLHPWASFLKPGFHPWQIDDRDLLARGENMLAALKLVTEGATKEHIAAPAKAVAA